MAQTIFLLVLFVANVIQAITGFAGTILAMPPSIYLIGLENARVVLNVLAMVSGATIAITSYKHINRKELFRILKFMLLGACIGTLILIYVPLDDMLIYFYGVFIILVALKNMLMKKEPVFNQVSGAVILVFAGIIHAIYVSGGALLVVYGVYALKDKFEFRSTIATIWVIVNALLAITHFQAGYFTPQNINYIAISIIPLLVATWVGTKLAQRMDRKFFLTLSYILLIISGGSLLL